MHKGTSLPCSIWWGADDGKMPSECEYDIKLIQKKIKQLKKMPGTDRRNFEIAKWEEMLGDVIHRAACIKELMSREGGGEECE